LTPHRSLAGELRRLPNTGRADRIGGLDKGERVRGACADRDLIIGITPGWRPDGRLVVGVSRAGALGVLDAGTDADRARAELELVVARHAGEFGVRLADGCALGPGDLPAGATTVVVDSAGAVEQHDLERRRVLVEVTSLAEARAAAGAGAHGLIVKGSEAGGRVGEETAFVLLQRLVGTIDLPAWLQGGIGLRTAAAAVAGGARGVVLDAQLALARDCSLPAAVRSAVAAMDGSETVVLAGHRIYDRPDLPSADPDVTGPELRARFGADDLHRQRLPIGQDGCLAAPLAARFKTAGGIVGALRDAIATQVERAADERPLAPGAGLAAARGTAYPIAQGPMTRVSDRAGFAAAVAEAGGLPFLALSLMPADDIRDLLDETRRLVGDRPWGVGILGFVPRDLREEQLAVVREQRPPVALIAGGRPSQAAPLEAEGIDTFLHVPSPGLLDRFLKDGARRFVFEGRECGGHVGPRSSFVLWESQIERLLAQPDLDGVEVLFAGGVHDALSSAMVATMAVPLVERGARIGVLMGTAYLFTAEAVESGAITPGFQDAAVTCDETVLLETAPGHLTRCVDSPYVGAFAGRKRELADQGADPRDMWAELETLNLGRLRIAAKGLNRVGDEIVEVGPDEQRREGMYMIGQVAALREGTTTVAALHAEVSEGSSELLASIGAERAGAVGEPGSPDGEPRPLDIAVIGTAGLFPQAVGVDRFWSNIVDGVDAIGEVPPERWSVERYYDPAATGAGAGSRTPSKWGGFLPDIPFDPLRHGIPPRSVTSIGNDQLLSLEVAAAALTDAGYADRPFDRERAAVVFGAETGTDLAQAYGFRSALPHFVGGVPDALADLPELTEDSFPGVLANVIAGRIANRLDLGGPNYTVDAACGSSMAALAAACHELTSGAADLVLCGGTDLHNGIYDYLLFSATHALSPTGRARCFDSSADGIVLGEGIGCIVLKRLADAERDGDRIMAVIDAVAASSDGRSLGLTAPRVDGQRRALERAYDRSGVSPASIGLVEAHATGTVVGDRTELATLTDVYSERGAAPGTTTLGSVKSQIGHTKCAAGIAGVIKAVHAVHRGVLPPTLHMTEPIGPAGAGESPFVFSDRARPWVAEERRAAVSAFGFGGANFHAVLSSYGGGDEPAHGVDHWPAELFLVRAKGAGGAWAELDRLGVLIDANEGAGRPWRLRDLARTFDDRPGRGPVVAALVADDVDDLRAKLDLARRGEAAPGVFLAPGEPTGAGSDGHGSETRTGNGSSDGAEHAAPQVAFLFPGQGSQRLHMLGDLFVAFPALRRHLELAGPELVELMLPPAAFGEGRRERAAALTDTRVAQPALGVAELAMTSLLAACGVVPDAAGGHSYGELTALAVAGAIDEHDLVALSRARGEAIVAASPDDDPGAMAAVRGPVDTVRALIEPWPSVLVANDNAPDQCVISGPTADVDAAVPHLAEHGHAARRLNVACGFHTPLLEPASAILAERLAGVDVGVPRLPVWCNTSAAPYPAEPERIREQLAGQVSAPVAFRPQVEAMYAAGARVFVEVGPGRVLTELVERTLGDRPHVAVATDVPGEHGLRRLLHALGELAVSGLAVDTAPLYEGRDAALVDVASPPARPPFLLNGSLVRDSAGRPVPGSLPPATQFRELDLSGASAATSGNGNGNGNGTGSEAQVAVVEFLRGMRELVSVQRDVLMSYLGAAPAALPAPGVPAPSMLPPAAIEATVASPAFPVASDAGASHGNGHHPPAPLDAAALLEVVVAIVSERTGYPAEMLDPDLDLEAELSIDSIKRIEVLGELAERVGLPGTDETGVDESVIEELALIKTLRGIVEWIEEHRDDPAIGGGATPPGPGGNGAAAEANAPAAPIAQPVPHGNGNGTSRPADAGRDAAVAGATAPGGGSDGLDGAGGPHRANRYVPQVVDAPTGAAARSLVGAHVTVVGPCPGVGDHLCEQLRAYGATVAVVAPGDPAPGSRYVVDLTALSPAPGVSAAGVVEQFELLRAAAQAGAEELVVVTGLGGTFGLGVDAPVGPALVTAGAAAAGLARTFDRELHGIRCRLVDVDPGGEPTSVARCIVDEVACADGPVEVGWSGDRRVTVAVVPRPLDAGAGTDRGGDAEADSGGAAGARRDLGPESVVVVTGGARGIGARLAIGLAQAYGCGVELLGRSPLPGDEPDDLRDCGDAVALRQAIIGRGELGRPGEIEAEVQRVLAAREIRATLASLSEHAAFVGYRSVDVRDAAALAGALDEIRAQRGRLDGAVHAAGVREDKLVRDKTAESFARVFDTKVPPAWLLADAVGPAGFLVLFSSVSGVFGNAGQVDYAAANSVLDGVASARGPHGRAVAIAWGPWAGTGMVTPELAREYARRGVGLIEPEDGVARAIEELRAGLPDPRVVVMAATPEALGQRAPAPGSATESAGAGR
jgi:acyl transferase domain-containing protein/NAD(P)H-dependent flavin oxidoreductase YrpB (nitropropane dioxygenase family)/NAD(P)-dependent dehydrogenase (short-subunit alcohol dehydrogenase family)